MSAPLTTTLRSRPGRIVLGTGQEPVISMRVQMPEVWDAIRIDAPSDTAVAVVKERALEALMPDAFDSDEFVMKLAGVEVLDENVSLTAAGAATGSTFLITGRRRRPVR